MEVRVTRAERVQKSTLLNLMQLYAYDFSEITELQVNDDGRFKELPLDCYWEDPWRFPFLIRNDAQLAGFALVHRKSRITGADDVWDMAEFFVLRRHRRAGVGLEAARRLFAAHPGQWEVRQRKENAAATAFWQKVIGAQTGGRFAETVLDDERWRGPVQSFTSC